jgi:SAM-dependent methyltransferase
MNEPAGKHWNQVYSTRSPDSVSWFQQEAVPSLHALDLTGAGPDKSLIDVGGGASTLVDALLDRGWSDVSILDIAAPALDAAKQRLEGRAAFVNWIVADVTTWKPTRRYDVWHDRAVFHFLTGESDREAYREALLSALQPGGAVVMATFGPRGPERCSGLPVRRYDAEELAAEIGSDFTKIADWTEDHLTPAGAAQAFTWCVLRKR